MNHLTDEEIISHARSGIQIDPELLIARLETKVDEFEESENGAVDESVAVAWAIACFEEHAGEGFHGDIIHNLRSALKQNKPEMKETIQEVIKTLVQMDQSACDELCSMKADGIQ